jgi:hypothetical protein
LKVGVVLHLVVVVVLVVVVLRLVMVVVLRLVVVLAEVQHLRKVLLDLVFLAVVVVDCLMVFLAHILDHFGCEHCHVNY